MKLRPTHLLTWCHKISCLFLGRPYAEKFDFSQKPLGHPFEGFKWRKKNIIVSRLFIFHPSLMQNIFKNKIFKININTLSPACRSKDNFDVLKWFCFFICLISNLFAEMVTGFSTFDEYFVSTKHLLWDSLYNALWDAVKKVQNLWILS